jgi:ABC-type polysaccharide/polyol phosphate transport system ATPase subunit
VAVKCNGLWKSYPAYRPRGIKDLIVGKRRSTLQKFARQWALRDVAFEAPRGEAVGIIGHNGSGKSTLLSLLLGTSRPDKGTVSIQGRIASLLDLGAGFHSELTGRDNIYVYGSILGMQLREIHDRFSTIVEYSELADAIENPTRTYSAGMVARLGFATVINAPADIVLIDEVLAVGDVSFQTKCLNSLRSFKSSGGTLIIVSHDLETLRDLCEFGICLNMGEIVAAGPMDDVVARYRSAMGNS